MHYLWNSVNGQPPTSFGAADTQAGQAIHFNATSGYKVSNLLYVGANGYLLKQITDSKANGLPLAGSREQVGALGPGAVFTFGKQFLFVNYYREFGAENSAFGNKLVLRYTLVLPKGH